jgi:hypothetical protein
LGKIREIPRRVKQPKKRGQALSPQQAARLAAFDAVVKLRDEQWAAMTPKERAEEMLAWAEVKKTINGDRKGYREVFVDD